MTVDSTQAAVDAACAVGVPRLVALSTSRAVSELGYEPVLPRAEALAATEAWAARNPL